MQNFNKYINQIQTCSGNTVKLGFIFDAEFDVLTPFQTVIADAQAATCYLAIELAKIGHNITIFSRNSNNTNAFGVRCRAIKVDGEALNLDKAITEMDYDAFIIINNSPELIVNLKTALPIKTAMYLWTEFAASHPANKLLEDKTVIDALDGIICVSDWQRSGFLRYFNIPREKISVKYYAITPCFEDLFIDAKEFNAVKTKEPQLAYIANPLTGLEILITAFPDIIYNHPTTELFLYEPENLGQLDREEISKILATATKVKGIRNIGAVSNVHLAYQLRSRNIFAYPNTSEDCSSIAIMNAMAAGLYVVTSNLGAIPEYCTEHGKCIIEKNLRSDSLDSFIGQVLSICQTVTNSSSTFYDYCFKQTIDLNKKHTWRARAREWTQLLEKTRKN